MFESLLTSTDGSPRKSTLQTGGSGFSSGSV
jgi:hypothetical protein